MAKWVAIEGYEIDGKVSLDKDYVYEISGYKSNASKRVIIVDQATKAELEKRQRKTFDYDYHSELTSQLKYDQADEYQEKNRKDIDLDEFPNVIVLPIKDLNKKKIDEYLADEELDIKYKI